MTATVDGARFMDEERLRWKEKQFQAAIIAAYVGTKRNSVPHSWRAYHSFFSDRSEAGFPDLVLVRERVVYVELKTEKGKLTPAQEDWREWLLAAGAEWYCFRPSDWNSGLIERVLR